jgi:hypothetical protein
MPTIGKGIGDSINNEYSTLTTPRFPKRTTLRRIFLAIFVVVILFISLHKPALKYNVEENIARYLSLTSEEQARLHDHQLALLEAGLRQCASITQQPISVSDAKRTNPRAEKIATPILIRNATLIDGDGSMSSGTSILLSEGVVKEIGSNVDPPKDCKVIDVGGRYVSPGLVDMVCHFTKFR